MSKKKDKQLEKILFKGVDPKLQDLLRPSINKLNTVEKGLLTLVVVTQRAASELQQNILNQLVQLQDMPLPKASVFYPDLVRNGGKKKSKKH